MKISVAILGVIILVVGGWLYIDNKSETNDTSTTVGEKNNEGDEINQNTVNARQVVMPGSYVVDTSASTVGWAGKKPLIDGYINSGTLDLSEGVITVTNATAAGSFTIDMNTLKVGLTAKKPGQESVLEGHLKGDSWFNVTEFPTASFNITNVSVRTDSDSTFQYDVTGDLTMKGVTNEINFPAEIYETATGQVQVEATTTIDRTRWGLTAMSGSFFDNLADNVIDDSIQLSFTLVADKN